MNRLVPTIVLRLRGSLLSKSQAVKALRHYFENKKEEVEAPGRVVVVLDNETNKQHGPATISVALEYMERRGEVTLEKAGKVINKATYKGMRPEPKPATVKHPLHLPPPPVSEGPRRPKPTAPEKKPWSPLPRRVRELTRDLPDYLEDKHCTPVVLTRRDEPVSKAASARITSEYLTLALKALRQSCDDEGMLIPDSGIEAIKAALDVELTHANQLFTGLGRLGLKVSTREGRKWRTIVEMQPETVIFTEEMIRKAIATGGSHAVTVETEPDAELVNEPEVAVQPEPAVVTTDDIVQRMVEIIEDLETQVAAKNQTIAELEARNVTLTAEKAAVLSQCETFELENMELKEKLDEKALISSRVVDVLQRYNQS